MKSVFIEQDEGTQKVYESQIVKPKTLSIFNSPLAQRIISELAEQPMCAMDLARKIGQHEQKIYYHLKKMKAAGVIKLERNEARFGMTAKIYSVATPVVSTKLSDRFEVTEQVGLKNSSFMKLMHPFIKDNKLNAKIFIGDTYAHGRFDTASTEGPHVIDLGIMIGYHVAQLSFPNYSLDTEHKEEDLKENLILCGNPRTNTIIDMINNNGKKYFENGSSIISVDEKKSFDDPRYGVIIRDVNPFNKNKKILIIGGVRTRGMKAAVIALTRFIDDIMNNIDKNDNFVRIIKGMDKTGDRSIDSIKIEE